MTLSLDGARERVIGHNQAVVQCVSAMWTYRYHNGYTVTLRGPFTASVCLTSNTTQNGASAAQSALPSASMLKINHIQFDSNLYEKHVSVDVITGNRLDANKTPQVRNAPTPSPSVNGAAVLPQPQLQPPQTGQRDDERWEEPRITYERAFIPAEPVNAFGIPQATMRCLEVRSPMLGFAGASPKCPHCVLVGGERRTDDRSHAILAGCRRWSVRCVQLLGESLRRG
jgi:LIM-domain binding protein